MVALLKTQIFISRDIGTIPLLVSRLWVIDAQPRRGRAWKPWRLVQALKSLCLLKTHLRLRWRPLDPFRRYCLRVHAFALYDEHIILQRRNRCPAPTYDNLLPNTIDRDQCALLARAELISAPEESQQSLPSAITHYLGQTLFHKHFTARSWEVLP
jgi:hypothetical protein